MGLLSGLKDRLFGKAGPTTEDLQSGGWQVVVGSLSGTTSETWENYSERELAQIYRKSSLAHACIRRVATSVSEPPIRAGKATDEGGFEVEEGHWAPELLRRPNQHYDYRLLLFYMMSRQLSTGRALVWKWRNRRGDRVNELWPLPTHWVGIETGGGSDLIDRYQVWQGKNQRSIPVQPSDMVNSYFPDPASTWKAVGPLQAASRDYQLDIERENYVAEMLDNLTIPGLGVFAKRGMDPEKKKDLRASLQDRAGKGKRGGTVFLEGEGVDAKMFNPLADLDLPGLITMTEARVCMSFGVPAELVGARTGLENSTYSNKAEARESFYKETMIPMWRSLGSVLTRGLLWPAGEEDLELRFDLNEIAELQADKGDLAEWTSQAYTSGVITRNEARSAMGFPPDDEDVRVTPVGGVEVPVEGEQQ